MIRDEEDKLGSVTSFRISGFHFKIECVPEGATRNGCFCRESLNVSSQVLGYAMVKVMFCTFLYTDCF